MENKEFYIDKDHFKIHAKLSFPEQTEEKMPLLIISHGLTGHMEEPHLMEVMRVANEEGFAVLRVELYGHGKTDGDFKNHNILEWVNELIYIVDYAKNLDFVTDLYLAGHSQGGFAALLAAGLKREALKGLLLLSPAISIREYCREGSLFGCDFDPVHIPEKLAIWETNYVSGNYARVAQKLPTEQAAADYEGEVFLTIGELDGAVRPAEVEALSKRYKHATFFLAPDEDHWYSRHGEPVYEAIRAFLIVHK